MSISALDTISLPDSFEPNSHDSFAHPHNCDNSWRIVQKQNPRLPSYNNSFNLDLREIAKGKSVFDILISMISLLAFFIVALKLSVQNLLKQCLIVGGQLNF